MCVIWNWKRKTEYHSLNMLCRSTFYVQTLRRILLNTQTWENIFIASCTIAIAAKFNRPNCN